MADDNPHFCLCSCLLPDGCDRSGDCGPGILNDDVDRVWAEQDFSEYVTLTGTGDDVIVWELTDPPDLFLKAKAVLIRIIAKAHSSGDLGGTFNFAVIGTTLDPPDVVMAPEQVAGAPNPDEVNQHIDESWTLYEIPVSINEDDNTRTNWFNAKLRIRRAYSKLITHYIRAMAVCLK